MSGPISAEFEMHRQRQLERVAHYLPIELERGTAPLEELWRIRDCRLRALLEHARQHSRWHAKRLEHELEAAGLAGAVVRVSRVDRLERHPQSGKLKRFVPLSRAG